MIWLAFNLDIINSITPAIAVYSDVSKLFVTALFFNWIGITNGYFKNMINDKKCKNLMANGAYNGNKLSERKEYRPAFHAELGLLPTFCLTQWFWLNLPEWCTQWWAHFCCCLSIKWRCIELFRVQCLNNYFMCKWQHSES